MERGTDWVRLWRDLVEVQNGLSEKQASPKPDPARSRGAHPSIDRHWAKRDSNRDFVVARLAATPDSTLLDIGAGTGGWSLLLAPRARHITALDSSPEMIERLRASAEAEHIDNISVVGGTWPDALVADHDFSLCSHGMYASADWPAFVGRMVQVTRRTCFLIMRAPTPDGIMAQAAMRVWGHPYDSPNFHVGYNALLQLGIFPNVLMADAGLWSPWTNTSLEQALGEVKRRLGLVSPCEHDDFLMDLLRRRLTLSDGQYVWPRSVRSALIYWDANSLGEKE
jgi:SAM-dependent methyltransferase